MNLIEYIKMLEKRIIELNAENDRLVKGINRLKRTNDKIKEGSGEAKDVRQRNSNPPAPKG